MEKSQVDWILLWAIPSWKPQDGWAYFESLWVRHILACHTRSQYYRASHQKKKKKGKPVQFSRKFLKTVLCNIAPWQALNDKKKDISVYNSICSHIIYFRLQTLAESGPLQFWWLHKTTKQGTVIFGHIAEDCPAMAKKPPRILQSSMWLKSVPSKCWHTPIT